MTPPAGVTLSRADVRAVFDGRPAGLLITAAPTAGILTCSLPGHAGSNEPLLVKVATGQAAAKAVEHEARLLVELRRRRLGPVERTIPRHVGMRSFDGFPVALSSTVPGSAMAGDDRRWLHTAQPWRVRRDFHCAADWLTSLQEASATASAPSMWVQEVTEAVRARWKGHPLLAQVLSNLQSATERLDGGRVPVTAVHGDFWHGNVLVDVDRATVSGVVNWAAGEAEGSPLRDLARFALRYSQHLGQLPHPAARVTGSGGFRYAGSACGARLVLSAKGWYARTVREYLQDGLERLGVPVDRWVDVALAGIAEIAAQDADERVAEDHLAMLSSLHPGSAARADCGITPERV